MSITNLLYAWVAISYNYTIAKRKFIYYLLYKGIQRNATAIDREWPKTHVYIHNNITRDYSNTGDSTFSFIPSNEPATLYNKQS